ncbi:hypothetical protein TNIN_227391 [Trichonephila inaurata madagascariensis]|uniref:Uncharacterized protein n=1 Tax=Trichonephila inaurata madagascariensis TaxID=2747483 RepID=A0A8X7BTB7_9ARAC|nr:hypothetical protein TNIN_227391 [Trichonephila inaurata madagascariensis]
MVGNGIRLLDAVQNLRKEKPPAKSDACLFHQVSMSCGVEVKREGPTSDTCLDTCSILLEYFKKLCFGENANHIWKPRLIGSVWIDDHGDYSKGLFPD